MINLEAIEVQSTYLAKKEFYEAVDKEVEKSPEERVLREKYPPRKVNSSKRKSLLQKIFRKG